MDSKTDQLVITVIVLLGGGALIKWGMLDPTTLGVIQMLMVSVVSYWFGGVVASRAIAQIVNGGQVLVQPAPPANPSTTTTEIHTQTAPSPVGAPAATIVRP